mgnify:CR=1 FL=1
MILGFAGKAATGKTTAAKHVEPLLNKECKIIPMAMVLRANVQRNTEPKSNEIVLQSRSVSVFDEVADKLFVSSI